MFSKRSTSLIAFMALLAGLLMLNSSVFALAPCDPHTPLDCSVVKITPKFDLTFNAGVPGTLLDKATSNLGTGFTMSQPSSVRTGEPAGDPAGTSYAKGQLTVNTTTGHLEVVTTKGLNVGTSNTQTNALGVGLAAPVTGTIVLDTTIVNLDLTADSAKFQQAGIWFGSGENNYLKFVVVDGTGGTYLETLEEVGGTTGLSVKSAFLSEAALAAGTLRLVLTINASATPKTATMQYSLNGGALVNAGTGTYTINNAVFNGVNLKDATVGSTSFVGIMTSHRNSNTPITVRYDYFSVRTSLNTAPVGNADNYTMDEDTTLTVNAPGVLANDTDANSDALTAALVTGPANGALTLNADGSFTYTPNPNYFGSDTFVYRATDGLANSANTTVTITVNDTPETPTAVDDAYSVDEDATLTVTAPGTLANDTNIGGRTMQIVAGPTSGAFAPQANGAFVYTPAPNFNGSDSFTYRLAGVSPVSNIATVTITVNAVNDPPVAVNDTYSTTLDTALTVDAASGVLANDTDVDGDTLEVTGVQTDVTNGVLTLNPDGSFTYTPDLGYLGPDSFVYIVSDGTVTATATASISVVNNAVDLIENGSFETAGGTAKTASKWAGKNLLKNDRRVCNNRGAGDTCAFRFQFVGRTNFTRQIQQTYNTPFSAQPGDSLTVSFQAKTNNLDEGASVQIVVIYADKTKATSSIIITSGTYDYQEFSRTIALTKNVSRIVLRARYNGREGNGGTFFLDSFNMMLSQPAGSGFGGLADNAPGAPAGVVPLPAAPDLRGN